MVVEVITKFALVWSQSTTKYVYPFVVVLNMPIKGAQATAFGL